MKSMVFSSRLRCVSFGDVAGLSLIGVIALLVLLSGCSGRTSILPNPDKALQKTATEFAADAAKRFPYKLDAPRAGQAEARAQVGYMLDNVEIVNLTNDEWTNVEIWVNQQYVVFVPTMQPHVLKKLPFQMIFDDKGISFPTNNNKVRVEKVELLRDGKMYDVKLQLAD